MGWSNWCVPELSLSAESQIKASEFELARAVQEQPEAVAALAAGLIRQNAMHQSMLAKAAGRIAELEAKLAIMEPVDDQWLQMAREIAPNPPRPWWAIRWPW